MLMTSVYFQGVFYLLLYEKMLKIHLFYFIRVNEWRLEEKDDENKDNCSVYTFLHRTLFLWLVYEKTSVYPCFHTEAACFAQKRKSHQMPVCQLRNRARWTVVSMLTTHRQPVTILFTQKPLKAILYCIKYFVRFPQLLHDVSLVVSRCRLVGEELRLLKMWGSLRFDILDISCSETQVHVVFSSLKKCCKFEVVFTARLTNQLCVFHVQSFKNLIGSTTIQQIEDIVASLSPGKNLFTKIIKKLHETLLS
ncbi:hypothetical protein XENOCAPTIV_002676 [Xenoophorus captivus]|uniref:Uncharacterized protein n=1 Tax=Xenoophorus captivus TaxID=1517983 RepID=A0ABV0Q8K0_9TELE